MKKLAFIAGALSLGLLASACASNGTLNPAAQAQVDAILAQTCPNLSAMAPLVPSFNGNVQRAYATLSLACPPNPAPTNAIVLVGDLVAAEAILAPYFAKKK